MSAGLDPPPPSGTERRGSARRLTEILQGSDELKQAAPRRLTQILKEESSPPQRRQSDEPLETERNDLISRIASEGSLLGVSARRKRPTPSPNNVRFPSPFSTLNFSLQSPSMPAGPPSVNPEISPRSHADCPVPPSVIREKSKPSTPFLSKIFFEENDFQNMNDPNRFTTDCWLQSFCPKYGSIRTFNAVWLQ